MKIAVKRLFAFHFSYRPEVEQWSYQLWDIRIKIGRHHFGFGVNREPRWQKLKREVGNENSSNTTE